MKELNTSLLREKFEIHDPGANPAEYKGPIVALSCRMVVELRRGDQLQETIVVRAQNMHSCVRMAAKILQSHASGGPLLDRPSPYDWKAAGETVLNDYERAFNPNHWIAVYGQGKMVFSKGEHHAFLDVIEKCSATNKGDYENAIPMAEKAFRATGKVVKIDYDGNVALVVHLESTQGRCGVILRGANQTTTFNFSAVAKGNNTLNFSQILSSAAAFLEGIQMAFMVGMNNEKTKLGKIAKNSPEDKQTREAGRRLSRLSAEIANLESACEVRYRPERPEFNQIVTDAEKLAAGLFAPKDKDPGKGKK